MMFILELIDLDDIFVDGFGLVPHLPEPLDPRFMDDPFPHQAEHILSCHYDLLNVMLLFPIDIPTDLPHQGIGFVFPLAPEVEDV